MPRHAVSAKAISRRARSAGRHRRLVALAAATVASSLPASTRVRRITLTDWILPDRFSGGFNAGEIVRGLSHLRWESHQIYARPRPQL